MHKITLLITDVPKGETQTTDTFSFSYKQAFITTKISRNSNKFSFTSLSLFRCNQSVLSANCQQKSLLEFPQFLLYTGTDWSHYRSRPTDPLGPSSGSSAGPPAYRPDQSRPEPPPESTGAGQLQ